MTKTKRPPRRLWALFDSKGEMAGTYDTYQEADADAVGPRFRPRYSVRAYDLVPVKQVKEREG